MRIAGTDLEAFIAEIFPVTLPSGSSNIIRAGAVHPEFNYLYARSMRVEPAEISKDDDYSATNDAIPANYKCTIQYDTTNALQADSENPDDNTADPVTHLTHRWSTGGEFLTLPESGLKWDDGTGEPVTQEVSAGIIVPHIEHQITWPRIINPPFTAIRNTIGTVNNAALTFQTGQIAAETLLFLGAEMQREVMSDGTRAWSVGYRFSERRVTSGDENDPGGGNPGGWNHFFRSTIRVGSGWYRLVKKGGADDLGYDATYAIFLQSDFSQLFLAETVQ